MKINLPKLGKFFLQLAIILIITYSLSNFIGLSRGGFDSTEILNLQTFYIIGGVFAIALICLFLYEYFVTQGDKQYGNSVGFASLGETPHLSIFKRFTALQIFFLSLIFFSVLALLNIYLVERGMGQQTYTGLGFLETQQFTAVDSIIYSTSLIPGAENLGAAVIIGLVMVLLGILMRKGKISKNVYTVLLIILIPIVVMLFGIGNHLLRYRGSEIALMTVAGFWFIGGFITAITGSFIPFWIMHVVNNGAYDLSRFMSNENIIIYFIFFIAALIILYTIIYRDRLLGERQI